MSCSKNEVFHLSEAEVFEAVLCTAALEQASDISAAVREGNGYQEKQYQSFHERISELIQSDKAVVLHDNTLVHIPTQRGIKINNGMVTKLARFMSRRVGEVFEKNALRAVLYEHPDHEPDSNTIETFISRLRESVLTLTEGAFEIGTIRGRGWHFGTIDETKAKKISLPDGVTFFPKLNELHSHDGKVELISTQQADILEFLYEENERRPGQVIKNSRTLEHLHLHTEDVHISLIPVQISKLKKKMRKLSPELDRIIVSDQKGGYFFNPHL